MVKDKAAKQRNTEVGEALAATLQLVFQQGMAAQRVQDQQNIFNQLTAHAQQHINALGDMIYVPSKKDMH